MQITQFVIDLIAVYYASTYLLLSLLLSYPRSHRPLITYIPQTSYFSILGPSHCVMLTLFLVLHRFLLLRGHIHAQPCAPRDLLRFRRSGRRWLFSAHELLVPLHLVL